MYVQVTRVTWLYAVYNSFTCKTLFHHSQVKFIACAVSMYFSSLALYCPVPVEC